ncbi:MAG: gliding motility-associated C-terminal domain-containing protein [Bacteroidales bacterium]|nr:gliding motility-associated C-terminal domain-containing protein [Bacteroidales bacterium]
MTDPNQPVINFFDQISQNINTQIAKTLTLSSAIWTDSFELIFTYSVIQTSKENDFDVRATVTGGISQGGQTGSQKTSTEFTIQMNQIAIDQVSFSTNNSSNSLIIGSTDLTIIVTYETAMDPDPAKYPQISFPVEYNTVIIPVTKNWESGNTVLKCTYTITENTSMDGISGNYTISGGADPSDVTGSTRTESFTADFVSPTIANITSGNISSTTTSHTITVQYSEDMAAVDPVITIEPVDANGIFTFQSGNWSNAKTYVATYTVSRTDPGVYTTATVKVNSGKDVAGNPQVTEGTTSINIDQRTMGVTASMSPSIIQSTGGNTATLTLLFNVEMDIAFIPSITFTPNTQNVLTVNSQSWTDNKTYTVTYNIDKSDRVAINNIAVGVDGTKSINGESMPLQTIPNVFSIDFNSPACVVTFSPEVVVKGTPTITFTVTYNMEMDPNSKPEITFGNALDPETYFPSPPQYNWSADNKTCTITYNVVHQQVQYPSVIIIVSKGESAAGNAQFEGRAEKNLVIDMLDILVTPSLNNHVTCNDNTQVVTLSFNQPMTETSDNIISFPGYDSNGFLEFSSIEWSSDKKDAIVTYNVHSNIASNQSNIPIEIGPVANFLGRVYPGETIANLFSVTSDPPVIDDALTASPKCYDHENGEIHLSISGGNQPYTYQWIKNDENYPSASGPENTSLGAGQYQIKVFGTDNCFALYETELLNPEPISLIAEIKQHVEKIADGEVLLKTEGGTEPYSYFINGVSEGGKTEYAGLDIGNYTFEVSDYNNCTAQTIVEIKDYRTPTIFSPNGDGINDIFMEGYTIEIFDRSGTLVYKGNNGWDGYYKGKLARPAIYFYIVTFPDGMKKKGSIQLYKK